MAAGQARQAHIASGKKIRIYDRYGNARQHEMWQGIPYIAKPGESGDTIINGPGVRPYILGKTPQRWAWREYRPHRAEIVFTESEQTFGLLNAGRIVLEPHIKVKASPNKDWGWLRWNKLVYLLGKKEIRVTQLGPQGSALLDRVDYVMTNTFREACAVLANSRGAVLHEGGLHHACAALNVPAVVIFGGFISPQVTGYEEQISLFRGKGIGCGMRVSCPCCKEAMQAITPEEVAEKLIGIIK